MKGGETEIRVIAPGMRRGCVTVPASKSHEHRLLIANFLAGERAALAPREGDNADIVATKRCLTALAAEGSEPVLDCGESGSTLRFLAPLAAALGKKPRYIRRGRLAERPFKDYATLAPGVHELAGNVSSQFVTGLLFALPLLSGDSEIRFTSPLESRGYVDMTLQVIRSAGITVEETAEGFRVPGGQRFRPQPHEVEGDWSGAAFWYAMNALGSRIEIKGLSVASAQPDRAVADLAPRIAAAAKGETVTVDMSGAPDLFPALAALAGGVKGTTRFVNIARLRLKESDRVAAMADVLRRFGVSCAETESDFTVTGKGGPLVGGAFESYGDHRIAMAIAVGATVASGPVTIDDGACVAKSYPGFWTVFSAMPRIVI